MQCRICLGEESPETLVRPCRCSGTIAYVHRACLDTSYLYSPDRICRVCRTPFDAPGPWLPRALFWIMLGGLGVVAVVMPERLLLRVASLASLGLLARIYGRLHLTTVLHPIVVLGLGVLVYSIDTAATALAVFGSLGGILTVYTLCTRIDPMLVLVGVMILFVFAYLILLTTAMFLSVGPAGFALYLSVLYLSWTLWIQAPRLIGG